MKDTIEYYNKNSQLFFEKTFQVDMSDIYKKFESYLPAEEDMEIMDLGCGVGRDLKYFKEKGYKTLGVDASQEMCKIAREKSNSKVLELNFLDLSFSEKFHGIWACASLLHLRKKDIPLVLEKLSQSLRENGIIYLSFKYGYKEGLVDERYFTNMNKKEFENILKEIPSLSIKESFYTENRKKNGKKHLWLNLILKKEKLL